MRKELNIGLFGFGCVGTGLYEVLNQSKLLNAQIKTIVVKDPNKDRILPKEIFKYDADAILEDENINVVIELINDSEAAFHIVSKALKKGKHVVSANKKLIAEHFQTLLDLANENGVSFLYEASVGGSIPIIRNLEEYYNNDSLSAVQGIVNGTTNYILTQANEGIAYAPALKKAQELGFAEIDPTLDVDGFDAKYKLVLLIKHAFGLIVKPEEVKNIGIRQIKPEDVQYASEKGFRIKLFAHAKKIENKVVGFVAPHFVKADHFAYQVNNEFNAVVVEALFSDKQLFIGKGAGSYPTASAVLSDVSALQFDYKYEYHKSNKENLPEFSRDFYVKVYLSSQKSELVNQFTFEKVVENYQGEAFTYKIGWVKFDALFAKNWNDLNELSLIVMPDEIKHDLKEEWIANETLELQN